MALAIDAPEATRGPPARASSGNGPIKAFLAVALLLALVVATAGLLGPRGDYSIHPKVPAESVLGGWLSYDGSWYVDIADHGYFYSPGQQSSVAFFPAYPIAVRALGGPLGSAALAAVVVTLLSGLASIALFWRWLRARVGSPGREIAVALLLLYPYAWFLYGAAYSDALFLAATIAAFVLAERGKLTAAGLAGAVATAARPVGIAVLIGLVVLVVTRRRAHAAPLRMRDSRVLAAGGGLLAWCAYLWARFGDPFAFVAVQSAPGWDQGAGPHTWLKVRFFEQLAHGDPWYASRLLAQAGLAVLFIAFVPSVVRRFGWGYGAYTITVLAIPLVGSGDFQGMGRYLLAAFPVFAAIGAALADRPRLVTYAITTSSATCLIALTFLFARGFYLT